MNIPQIADEAATNIETWLFEEGFPIVKKQRMAITAIIIEALEGVAPERDWCDHCSGDLEQPVPRVEGRATTHVLCEKCYRRFAGPRWFDPDFDPTADSEQNSPLYKNGFRAGVAACVEKVRGLQKKWDDNADEIEADGGGGDEAYDARLQSAFAQGIANKLQSLTDPAPPPVPAREEDGERERRAK